MPKTMELRFEEVIRATPLGLSKLREYGQALITGAVTGKLDVRDRAAYDPPSELAVQEA